ncbi:homeobox protein prospero-like [Pollicipes pollicipes]|uniref:homeobox protein prospero-like n=1 Tax=Pollicipes pollicipes TaxID=41117 RepID=UPI00188539E9|nr:homeobox protein prospero-like [Pollicipes pollicipes]
MMSPGEEDPTPFGDKSECRRGRPRQRVDAGEARGALSGFTPLRPWFSACPSVVSPFSPVCWMSPGVLAAAGAHCAGMGVSQVERLGAGPAVNNALLRDILARGGVNGAPELEPRRFSAAEPSAEVQADSSQQPPGDEDEDEDEMDSAPASPAESEKKSRLESIVSGMRHGSGSPQPINGCKKRKLYQPVQHEASARASGEESDADVTADEEPSGDKQRRVEPDDVIQSQLKSVQSQLELMQERYAQLYRGGGGGGGEQPERCQDGGELDLSRRAPQPSPEKPRDDAATRPVPALHKIEAEPPTAGTFIDYARRVLGADPRNKENERRPEPTGGRPARAGPDVEGLADALKSELTQSMAGLIDSIVSKWAQQRRKEAEPPSERRSPRAEILRRISQHNGRFPGLGTPFAGADGLSPFGLPGLGGMRPPGALPQLFPASRAAGFGGGLGSPVYSSPYSLQALRDSMQQQEQDEGPLSLVMTPKKKRHKVTDTRALPRPAGRMPGDDGRPPAADSPSPRPFGGPPPPPPPHMLPASLPTSVAIPNPSLQESHFFGGYPYYQRPASSPGRRDSASPPQPAGPGLLHPALLAAGRRSPPDSIGCYRRDTPDRSDCNSLESGYDGQRSNLSFSSRIDARSGLSLTSEHSSTLTPMHLRKAKLMFFWSRYPSSSILKSFFPDINFNKNNTAQLVKWFSNFREFFYIQMEKYARQAVSEGVKTAEELTVTPDCELLRVLNLHYNRNNHIEIPTNFPYVAEAALREFFRALQAGKDAEPSWKKAIYKVIARLDENVPEYFRLPSFLEQLE